MRSIGVVRSLDRFGRIVIPIEIRQQLNITEASALEYHLDHVRRCIVLCKREDECVFCGGRDGLLLYAGRYVCASCRAALPAARPAPVSQRFSRSV